MGLPQSEMDVFFSSLLQHLHKFVSEWTKYVSGDLTLSQIFWKVSKNDKSF
jgi:hypothetical protein